MWHGGGRWGKVSPTLIKSVDKNNGGGKSKKVGRKETNRRDGEGETKRGSTSL